MKILIPSPGLGKHGGIRVIIELANRLADHHEVVFWSLQGLNGIDYWKFHENVKFNSIGEKIIRKVDCMFITSPHSVQLEYNSDRPKKIFHHLQMLEHLFLPGDRIWFDKCKHMYKTLNPMFSISEWNIRELKQTFKRAGETIYIGNGLNFDDFPIERNIQKNKKTILIEGWQAHNDCKDVNKISHKAAKRLKELGYKIISFGILPVTEGIEHLDKYYFCPNLETMNKLYREASLLLKCSKYDARSCSPVEAMSKGTPTIRAIVEGDDDLIHDKTAIRLNYNDENIIEKIIENIENLLTNEEKYGILQENCFKHLEENTWDKWIKVIRDRIEC